MTHISVPPANADLAMAMCQYLYQYPLTGDQGAVVLELDGGTSVPSTGSKGYTARMPYSGTIIGWSISADQVGSAQFDVRKCPFASLPATVSIVAAAPPALVAGQFILSTTLTGWTLAVTAGDVFEFILTSISGCHRLTLEIQISKA